MKFSCITSAYNQLELIRANKEHWDKQTFRDFEWIIADDGSTDGVREWAKENKIKVAGNEVNRGYRLGQALNRAVDIAGGDYLVWVMGDSYPKEDFLGQLNKAAASGRVVSGIRLNVEDGIILSTDWRIDKVKQGKFFGLDGDTVRVRFKRPWELMTLNSMCMPKKMFAQIGGMYEGYRGYGREDWDLAMRAHFDGAELWWAVKAVIYHRNHSEKAESPENIKLFDKRVKEFQK